MKAKTKVKFTKTYIDAIKPAEPGKRDTYYDSATAGLLLRVTEHGRKSFYFVRTIQGRGEKLFIGHWPECDIDTARAKCGEHVAKIFRGENPAEQKREEERDTRTRNVEMLITTFSEKELGWPEGRRLLSKEVAPAWKHKQIDKVARSDVKHLLSKIVDRGSPGTANHTLDIVRRFMNWAIDEEYITINPCTGMKHPAPINDGERTLSDDEIKELLTAIETFTYPTGPYLKFLLLTAQRRGEVSDMKWEHVNLQEALWTQPTAETKNKIAPHLVPLSQQAVQLLETLPRGKKGTFVFSTTAGEIPINGFSKLKSKLDKAIAGNRRKANVAEDMPKWGLHDIRRSVRTWFGGNGITEAVGEAVLNHVETSRSRLSRIYDRHNYLPEKRSALQAWADHVLPRATAKVVQMKPRRKR